jgi:glycerol-3-phosphate O-acyltransferase
MDDGTARVAERGVLYELEQHRLRRNGAQQLRSTAALCDELLTGELLPAAVARELRSFRADVADALQFKARELAEKMIS